MANHITPKEFRSELVKIMPGYTWSIHDRDCDGPQPLLATGKLDGGGSWSRMIVSCETSENGTTYTVAFKRRISRFHPEYSSSDYSLLRAVQRLRYHYAKSVEAATILLEAVDIARETRES